MPGNFITSSGAGWYPLPHFMDVNEGRHETIEDAHVAAKETAESCGEDWWSVAEITSTGIECRIRAYWHPAKGTTMNQPGETGRWDVELVQP